MNYRVELTARAEADLDEILSGIQRHAPNMTAAWYFRLMASINALDQLPDRCSLADEGKDLGCELRELIFGKRRGTYRILFLIVDETVQVLHIRRAARGPVIAEDLS